MADELADLPAIIARAMEAWRPPARLSLSDWAERHFVLSSETAAEPGRWHTLPYQHGILDAITDPDITQVTVMKSARVGYTLCMSAAIGYFIHYDPTSILVVQPTVEDAKNFSKETIAPMLRDVPVLARVVFRDLEDRGKGPKDSTSTLTHKAFPGGVLSLVGANSGTGFRRVSRRVVMFDEVDAYPPSAGSEGDPIALGMKRSEYFWNRKILAGSTPLIAGSSRIEEMFSDGDRRRYYVPCPHCGHMDFLRFRKRDGNEDEDRGHRMHWPENAPEKACFDCRACGCEMAETHKRAMLEAGEWRADGEFAGHASFHIWSAYSLSPNATWGQIATEFLAAKRGGTDKLRTFVNTTLGETWKERGEAPDWERLYERRETYALGTVPAGAIVVTGGVDVQKDRLMYELVGWAPNKESWSVDKGALYGDTSLEATEPGSPWRQLDELLGRALTVGPELALPVAMLAIDSGYNTQIVYNWARGHPMSRVIACKGVAGARMLVGAPSPVDVTVRGKRLQRGYKVWPIGVDIAKGELYGSLQLRHGAGDPPAGYCHFPEYDEEYFQQLTAEHLVTSVNRRTHRAKLEWQVIPNRENHYLDCRVLARVAAAVLGIDRMKRGERTPQQPRNEVPVDGQHAGGIARLAAQEPGGPAQRPAEDAQHGFWSGKRPRGAGRPGGWFGRRR